MDLPNYHIFSIGSKATLVTNQCSWVDISILLYSDCEHRHHQLIRLTREKCKKQAFTCYNKCTTGRIRVSGPLSGTLWIAWGFWIFGSKASSKKSCSQTPEQESTESIPNASTKHNATKTRQRSEMCPIATSYLPIPIETYTNLPFHNETAAKFSNSKLYW